MKYFVFYKDDYYEMGGVGFEEFDEVQDALDFISNRLVGVSAKTRKIDDYILLQGYRLPIKSVEITTKVVIGQDEGNL